LRTERLGPLPLLNHVLERLGLRSLLERFVPTANPRCRLPYALGIGVLLRSILVEREPIYRQQETVETFAPEAFGLDPERARCVGDDAIGHALDRLFDADRGSLLTEVVVAAGQRFEVTFEELHNDSTTVRLSGQYPAARGRSIRGRRAPFITYGHSKERRGDLKQLLLVLTTTRDGAIPAQFRCEAGNASDSRTHEETWDTLCHVTGKHDFLYVGDSKLCSAEAMGHIARGGGRFLTVMPRNRHEDREFREWIQTHEPPWEIVWDREHPRRRRTGARERWCVLRHPVPSREGWPVTWVWSSLLTLRQGQSRRERLTRAIQELEDLAKKLAGPRCRLRSRVKILLRVERIFERRKVERYLAVRVLAAQEHLFRQVKPGRPGPNTHYKRKTRKRWRLEWTLDNKKIAYDAKSDGMYPLLTNDPTLTPGQVLQAHKRQPSIEKRFEQTKTVFEIAPVLLKNEGRIEALFFVYFLALLVQALLERELRRAMQRTGIEELPLYPEERTSRRPTAEQILRLFSLAQRHTLFHDGKEVRVFEPELTDLQRQVLHLLSVPEKVYTPRG